MVYRSNAAGNWVRPLPDLPPERRPAPIDGGRGGACAAGEPSLTWSGFECFRVVVPGKNLWINGLTRLPKASKLPPASELSRERKRAGFFHFHFSGRSSLPHLGRSLLSVFLLKSKAHGVTIVNNFLADSGPSFYQPLWD